MLLLIAIVIAVGLDPAVRWLERHRWPRSLAASACVLIVVGAIVPFLSVTWTSLSVQSSQFSSHITAMERELQTRAPRAIIDVLQRSQNNADASVLAPYIVSFGQSVLWAAMGRGCR
jgi:predicted PurR-regulated permease PerM